jgi:hypothetical protein
MCPFLSSLSSPCDYCRETARESFIFSPQEMPAIARSGGAQAWRAPPAAGSDSTRPRAGEWARRALGRSGACVSPSGASPRGRRPCRVPAPAESGGTRLPGRVSPPGAGVASSCRRGGTAPPAKLPRRARAAASTCSSRERRRAAPRPSFAAGRRHGKLLPGAAAPPAELPHWALARPCGRGEVQLLQVATADKPVCARDLEEVLGN